ALHSLGMHGSKYANVAVNKADLVLALGVRFDDRVTGNVKQFIADGRIIHIDIDRNELNKNKTVTLPICADIKPALEQLIGCAECKEHGDWLAYVSGLRERYPFEGPEGTSISPQYSMRMVSDLTDGEAIVSLGVGQHQMWAMQHYRSKRTRSFLSSSGFGTMGYGLPAAIGAKVACPDRQVIDIDGDGSLNMTIHELATCRRYGVGVKVVVINNQWLGLVRQWQGQDFEEHPGGTGVPEGVQGGGEGGLKPGFPDHPRGLRGQGGGGARAGGPARTLCAHAGRPRRTIPAGRDRRGRGKRLPHDSRRRQLPGHHHESSVGDGGIADRGRPLDVAAPLAHASGWLPSVRREARWPSRVRSGS